MADSPGGERKMVGQKFRKKSDEDYQQQIAIIEKTASKPQLAARVKELESHLTQATDNDAKKYVQTLLDRRTEGIKTTYQDLMSLESTDPSYRVRAVRLLGYIQAAETALLPNLSNPLNLAKDIEKGARSFKGPEITIKMVVDQLGAIDGELSAINEKFGMAQPTNKDSAAKLTFAPKEEIPAAQPAAPQEAEKPKEKLSDAQTLKKELAEQIAILDQSLGVETNEAKKAKFAERKSSFEAKLKEITDSEFHVTELLPWSIEEVERGISKAYENKVDADQIRKYETILEVAKNKVSERKKAFEKQVALELNYLKTQTALYQSQDELDDIKTKGGNQKKLDVIVKRIEKLEKDGTKAEADIRQLKTQLAAKDESLRRTRAELKQTQEELSKASGESVQAKSRARQAEAKTRRMEMAASPGASAEFVAPTEEKVDQRALDSLKVKAIRKIVTDMFNKQQSSHPSEKLSDSDSAKIRELYSIGKDKDEFKFILHPEGISASIKLSGITVVPLRVTVSRSEGKDYLTATRMAL